MKTELQGLLNDEPAFHTWRVRMLKRSRALCMAGTLIGPAFLKHDPVTTLVVSGLGVIGIIVTTYKLSRIDNH